MTIKELIDELKKYDPDLEVVTNDGYGCVDPIFQVIIKNVCSHDGGILKNETEGGEKMVVLG